MLCVYCKASTTGRWLAAGREKAVAEARTKLAAYPQPVVTRFETLLKAAQTGIVIKEDNHWVIERLFYRMRRLALEFGQRLAEAGELETVEDVFFLTADELLAGSLDAGTLPGPERVRQRKAEREHFSRVTPPPMPGTTPPFAPDVSSPFVQAMNKADFAIGRGGSDAQSLQGLEVDGDAGMVRILASL